MMTRMAMDEKQNGSLNSIIGVSRKEYISNRRFTAFFLWSFVYWALFAVLIVLLYILFIEQMTRLFVILALIAGGVGYITFIYLVMRLSKRFSTKKYNALKKRLDRARKNWDQLEMLYEDSQEEI